MMLSWLANKKGDAAGVRAADELAQAMTAVLADKEAVTPDLGGSGTTTGMGQAICRKLEQL